MAYALEPDDITVNVAVDSCGIVIVVIVFLAVTFPKEISPIRRVSWSKYVVTDVHESRFADQSNSISESIDRQATVNRYYEGQSLPRFGLIDVLVSKADPNDGEPRERGERNIPLPNIVELARAPRVPPDALLDSLP